MPYPSQLHDGQEQTSAICVYVPPFPSSSSTPYRRAYTARRPEVAQPFSIMAAPSSEVDRMWGHLLIKRPRPQASLTAGAVPPAVRRPAGPPQSGRVRAAPLPLLCEAAPPPPGPLEPHARGVCPLGSDAQLVHLDFWKSVLASCFGQGCFAVRRPGLCLRSNCRMRRRRLVSELANASHS